MQHIRIIDEEFLARLAADAAESPRRRKNENLHAANEYPCHRLLNALMADTYIQPHCHKADDKDETVALLKGRLGLIEFSPDGQVLGTRELRPGMVADIPHGTFHGWCCLDDGSVFIEAKAGPYAPLGPDEKGAWAPVEGAPECDDYLAWMKSLFSA